MTASIKEREDKLCDRGGYVEDQKLKAKTKRAIEPARNTGEAKENEIQKPEEQVKDEDGIVFDRTHWWTKRATIGRACSKNCRSKKEAIMETWL